MDCLGFLRLKKSKLGSLFKSERVSWNVKIMTLLLKSYWIAISIFKVGYDDDGLWLSSKIMYALFIGF